VLKLFFTLNVCMCACLCMYVSLLLSMLVLKWILRIPPKLLQQNNIVMIFLYIHY